MSIESLVELSHTYGSDPEFVLAGGGNTSFKDRDTLFIKGSGTSLADIGPEGFVKMDRPALKAIWSRQYPEDAKARESAVLADLMAARKKGEESKRPSVETLLHDILPAAFVVHTHPAKVNGLCCSKGGEASMKEVLGKEALWIPSMNPGYILSKAVKDAMDGYRSKNGALPSFILLQNHGVFIGADTIQGIDGLYKKLMEALSKKIERQPDFSESRDEFGPSSHLGAELLKLAYGDGARASGTDGGTAAETVLFRRNREIESRTASLGAFDAVASAYTPDHIVYSGSDPLFVDCGDYGKSDPEAYLSGALPKLVEAWTGHTRKFGKAPKIVAIRGIGVFSLGSSRKAAELAMLLFQDTLKVARYAESFGGSRFMDREQIDFINNWEVEQYRSKISTQK